MAQGTPESDFSIECFQNYTAPEVFIQGLAGIVNQSDVESMIRAQKQMLQRFEKTNEMLINCNQLSAGRLKTAGAEFKKHTQLLVEMKKDLDYIFKKIRIIKTKLNAQYPQAFAEAQRSSLAEEAEEDDNAIGTSDTKTVDLTNSKKSNASVVRKINKPDGKPVSSSLDEPRPEFNFEQRPLKVSDSSSTDNSNHSNNSNDNSDSSSDT